MDRRFKVRLGVLLGVSVFLLPVALWAGQLYITFKCCSTATVQVDLTGVPNPSTKPTAVVGTAQNVSIEIACLNPAGNGISPGNAFIQQLVDESTINLSDITGKGKATVFLLYPLDGYEQSQYCVNPNWSVVPNSAWLLNTTIRVDWFYCNGDATNDLDPCTETVNGEVVFTLNTTKPVATKTYFCQVPPSAVRNPDGTAPHDVTYTCTQV